MINERKREPLAESFPVLNYFFALSKSVDYIIEISTLFRIWAYGPTSVLNPDLIDRVWHAILFNNFSSYGILGFRLYFAIILVGDGLEWFWMRYLYKSIPLILVCSSGLQS